MIKIFNTALSSYHLVSFAFLTLLLSGCSTMLNKTPSELIKQSSQQRIEQLQQLNRWQVKGKIAFYEGSNRSSATLSWRVNENKAQQQLNLTTYLGINVLQLHSNANNHKIQVDGKTYHGKDLEALIHSIAGFPLPTQALSFWLKGIPYQSSDDIIYQKNTELPHSLSSLYNNELWQVSYSNYQQFDGYNLATKFSIKKEGLLIKISIKDWMISQEETTNNRATNIIK